MRKMEKFKKINKSINAPDLINEELLIDNSFNNEDLDNTFIVVKSINNLLYLIYSTNNNSIVCYNLYTLQQINEIKGHHNKTIINFKHYLDTKNKRDLIMSISRKDNNIRIWNLYNFECIYNLKIKYFGFICTACFIKDNDNIYIISNINTNNENSLGVIDSNGNIVKEINGSTEIVCFIDIYFDEIFSKNYILFGNLGFVHSYDYARNKIYHRYFDKNGDHYKAHSSIIINNSEKIIKLIESSRDGNIRIWDFHSGNLLKKILIGDIWLNGICLWNDDYLFVGCDDKEIKLVNLKSCLIIKTLNGNNNSILTIKKIFVPQYGDCLISQEKGKGQIKLWKDIH